MIHTFLNTPKDIKDAPEMGKIPEEFLCATHVRNHIAHTTRTRNSDDFIAKITFHILQTKENMLNHLTREEISEIMGTMKHITLDEKKSHETAHRYLDMIYKYTANPEAQMRQF